MVLSIPDPYSDSDQGAPGQRPDPDHRVSSLHSDSDHGVPLSEVGS
jgi:hypothetical protein